MLSAILITAMTLQGQATEAVRQAVAAQARLLRQERRESVWRCIDAAKQVEAELVAVRNRLKSAKDDKAAASVEMHIGRVQGDIAELRKRIDIH
jgi:hypothetical protein